MALMTSHKWNYIVFVLLWLAYFPKHNVLKVHPYCSMWQNFSAFSGEMILYMLGNNVYATFCFHSSVNGPLSCFCLLAIVKSVRSHSNSAFNFLRNQHLSFHCAPLFWCPSYLICSLLTSLPQGICRSWMCGWRGSSLLGWPSRLYVCLPGESRPDGSGLETRQSW